jgi:FlaA1/EpsC-like NDP-sugar epimerase
MRRRIRSAAFPVHRHALPQLLVDGVLVALAYVLAYRLRFDFKVPSRYAELFEVTLPWVVPATLAVMSAFGLYQRLWTFVGQRDYEAVVKAMVISTLVVVGAITLLHPVETPPQLKIGAHSTLQVVTSPVSMPASVVALYLLLALALLIGARFLVHLVTEGRIRTFPVAKNARDVLIVGGGQGGRLVVRELSRNPQLRLRPVGYVDDDPRKQGIKDEHGLKVLGTTAADVLPRVLDEVEPDEVIIAIPSAPGTVRARVVAACRERGIPVRTTPTVFELLQDGTGQARVARQLREVRVEDVLGREPVLMELERVGAYLAGQVVLVTGAGGSIGGELSRQIARVGPSRLVLVDHAEDNLFEIVRELEDDRHVRTAVPVLADCKEEERMREVLSEHRPAVVFHAAAYKHVSMMEMNPVEAVRNNALATRLMARIAGDVGVGTFVLVSTDKAVKPATVMGASKALAEWAVEAAAKRHPATRYATVRFGNVLASSGSVVPIFRRQIAAGGPVTVTDPRMRRYFMTIPEAVQLIIRVGSLSEGSGEVFVLEMGEPVRIVDLAEAMIRLSGLEPERDIAIEFVGARPGEKFHEDLYNPYERPQPTPAQKIVRAARRPLDPAWVERTFGEINLLVLEGDAAALAAEVSKLSTARAAPALAAGTGSPVSDGRHVAARAGGPPASGGGAIAAGVVGPPASGGGAIAAGVVGPPASDGQNARTAP